MTTAYNIARLPIDTAKGIGELIFWPVHFGKTVATNTVDTMFKIAGTNTEDVPKEQGGESIFDMAKSNLDIASMIYYYTELRSEIKLKLKEFAKQKGMILDSDDQSQPSKKVNDLYNAVQFVKTTSEIILSPESTSSMDAMNRYQTSIEQLDKLCKKYKLDKGDLDVFKTVGLSSTDGRTIICICNHVKADFVSFIDSNSPRLSSLFAII
jgi:hypothetical protein